MPVYYYFHVVYNSTMLASLDLLTSVSLRCRLEAMLRIIRTKKGIYSPVSQIQDTFRCCKSLDFSRNKHPSGFSSLDSSAQRL